jgi:hypothetical protein
MNDSLITQKLQCNYQICYDKFGLNLRKSVFLVQEKSKISAVSIICNQIQNLSILKGIMQVSNERTINSWKNVSLVHYLFYWLFCYNLLLKHLFHCIFLSIFLERNFPYFSISTLSNHKVALKAWSLNLKAMCLNHTILRV